MSHSATARPAAGEYSPGVADYIALVPAGDLLVILAEQLDDLIRLIASLTDEQALVRHAPYTWSIKQVVGHLTDCERIMGYRTLRLARNDATPLPGFDENAYMAPADFDRCAIADLLAEFELLRRSHLIMLGNLSEAAWQRSGTVNNHRQSARAAACVLTGHAEHHLRILHKRLDAAMT